MVLFYVARVVIKRNLQIVSPRSRKKKKTKKSYKESTDDDADATT